MEVKVNRDSVEPLYLQIARALKMQIMDGKIPRGAVLPSERSLSKELGVHRNTIVKSYNVLKDNDLVETRQGKGYFVISANPLSEDLEKKEGNLDKREIRYAANWQGLIKEKYQDLHYSFDDTYMKTVQDADISFAAGVAEDVYGSEKIAEDLASLLSLRENKRALITPYQGDENLIRALAKFVRRQNVFAQPWEIQVLYELNQAMDFLVAILISENDYVIVEEPVSPDVYRAIELAGGKIITVPVDNEGMMVDGLEPLVEKFSPKFIYVSTGYKDPTGTVLSLERRHKLIALSQKYRLPIVEDNSGFDLNYDGQELPSLKSMDTCGNVVYFYSFGLTFVPGLSLAFVIANRHLIDAMRYLVSMRIVTIDWIPQKLMAAYLEDGTYHDKVREISKRNKHKRDIMAESLNKLKDNYGFTYTMPEGGAYIWLRLPEGVSSGNFAEALMSEGISVLPGSVFCVKGNGLNDYLRLNFTFENEERLKLGMDKFVETAQNYL